MLRVMHLVSYAVTLVHEKSGPSRSHDLPLSLQSPILMLLMKPFCLISLTAGVVFLLSGLRSCSIPLSGSSSASNHSYTSSTAELPQLKISGEFVLITFLPDGF